MTEPGRKIGSLRIVEQLGEGGMGEVFVAFDEKLQREVALKAVHGHKRDAQRRARLLYEARVLSQLDHPNVCRIYDYLESAEGDYLVLELIRGRNLRQVFGRGRVEGGLALRIAEGVVAALVAAHAKGIVHRDLKAENVMLTDAGETKVLDFGLARAFGGDEDVPEPAPSGTATTRDGSTPAWVPAGYQRTELGAVTGTVAAMSPEQARGEPATTASDLYSLGLLLQELFTGRSAYEPGLDSHLLLVRAAEGRTRPMTEGDPDLVELVQKLKSLAPAARPTAVEVAARLRDLRAKPARRRRRLAVAALLAATLAGACKYTFDLRRERQAAVAAQAEAEQVADFLVDLFEVSDPGTSRGQTITAREVLDAGAARLAHELADQPAVRARLQETIGNVYRKLGLYEPAAEHLREALALREELAGPGSLEAAASLHGLGLLDVDRGRYPEAADELGRALAIRERRLGREHPLVAASLNALVSLANVQGRYAEAEPLALRALEIRRAATGEDDLDVAESLQQLGSVHAGLRRWPQAQGYYEGALAIREKRLGPDHPDVALTLEGIGAVLAGQGKYAEAEPYHERSLAILEESLGPDHLRVSLSLVNLAVARSHLGRPDAAEDLLRRMVAIREKIYGPDHPRLMTPLGNLASACAKLGKVTEALELTQRAARIGRTQLGPDDPRTLLWLSRLATLYYEQADYARSEPLFAEVAAANERRVAADPADVAMQLALANSLLSLGEVRRAAGELAAARATWERSLAVVEPLAAGSDDANLLGAQATALLCLERIEEARPVVARAIAGGYRQADFLALARKHGLVPRDDRGAGRP